MNLGTPLSTAALNLTFAVCGPRYLPHSVFRKVSWMRCGAKLRPGISRGPSAVIR